MPRGDVPLQRVAEELREVHRDRGPVAADRVAKETLACKKKKKKRSMTGKHEETAAQATNKARVVIELRSRNPQRARACLARVDRVRSVCPPSTGKTEARDGAAAAQIKYEASQIESPYMHPTE